MKPVKGSSEKGDERAKNVNIQLSNHGTRTSKMDPSPEGGPVPICRLHEALLLRTHEAWRDQDCLSQATRAASRSTFGVAPISFRIHRAKRGLRSHGQRIYLTREKSVTSQECGFGDRALHGHALEHSNSVPTNFPPDNCSNFPIVDQEDFDREITFLLSEGRTEQLPKRAQYLLSQIRDGNEAAPSDLLRECPELFSSNGIFVEHKDTNESISAQQELKNF